MHKDVKECADSGDFEGIKYIFVDCLDVDPTFEKYAEDFEYCKNLPGLFEEHKELTPTKHDKNGWDDSYWVDLKVDLLKNFSLERFWHMREVAKVVLADKIVRITEERRQAAQKAAESQKVIKSEIPLVNRNSSNSVKMQREQQERELAQARERLEKENEETEMKIKKEQAERKERAEKQSKIRLDSQHGRMTEEPVPKKGSGAVLIAVIIIIIIVIIILL